MDIYSIYSINPKPQKLKSGISASLMCADLLNLERDIKILERSGCAYLHFDIMDGSFVPNITLSLDLVKAVRNISKIPADIHLMVNQPENYINNLKSLGLTQNDIISVHAESTNHIQRILASIRDMGVRPAAAINPGTPLCMIEEILPDIDMLLVMTVNPGYAGQKLIPQTMLKIAAAKKLFEERGFPHISLEADGCVSFENAAKMKAAGVDIYVAGTSSVFKNILKTDDSDISANLEKNIYDFLKIIN